jgi:threonyl-tRNA synthetase
MERFIGVLIEHFAGEFPLWLAPVQVAVLTISDKANAYAQEVVDALKAAGLRVEANLNPDKINAKVRAAIMEKIPYQLVVGERDAANRTVSVRTKSAEQGAMSVEEFINRASQEIESKGQSHATAAARA